MSDDAIGGFNVCLMGPSGSGKTHAIGTLVDAGVDVFCLFLESGRESLMGYYTDYKKPIPENLHWHEIQAPKADFASMLSDADKISTLSLDALSKMQDPNRGKHDLFKQVLTALNDFPDDRSGKKFGSVIGWNTRRALVIDGLTGLGRAAMSLVIGGKPVRSQSDWGIAQDQVEKLLRMICDGCQCHFVLIAHVERETDMVLGGVKLMVSTLGKALAPKIPSMFSDVILTARTGKEWSWDTASSQADVKTRNLPIAAGQTPTFASIVAKWKSRGGVI